MYEKFNHVSTNYLDQLNYFKYGLKAFENTKYNNSIKYQNNILIMKEQVPNFISPLILDVSTPNTETVLVIFFNNKNNSNNFLKKNPIQEDNSKKSEMRKEQALRLKETMIKRKEERKLQQQTELQDLEKIIECHNSGNNINQFKVKILIIHFLFEKIGQNELLYAGVNRRRNKKSKKT